MPDLSQRALELLTRAGWRHGRTVDVVDSEIALSAAGFPALASVSAFLAQFGGLEIRNVDAIPPAAEDWYFDVRRALRDGASVPRVMQYVRRLGTELAPIGYGFGGYMLLMMDAQGRVYGGYDQFLASVGSSGVDAINALSDGRELPAVER